MEAVRDTSLGKNGKCALILSQTLSELATSHDQDLQWGTMRDTQSGNSQVRHFHLQQRGREGEFKSRVKLLPVISSARSSQTFTLQTFSPRHQVCGRNQVSGEHHQPGQARGWEGETGSSAEGDLSRNEIFSTEYFSRLPERRFTWICPDWTSLRIILKWKDCNISKTLMLKIE